MNGFTIIYKGKGKENRTLNNFVAITDQGELVAIGECFEIEHLDEKDYEIVWEPTDTATLTYDTQLIDDEGKHWMDKKYGG